MSTSSSLLSGSSGSDRARDVLWERALGSLPVPLASGLRLAELKDPGLSEYTRYDLEEVEKKLGFSLGGDCVVVSAEADTHGHRLPRMVHGRRPKDRPHFIFGC